MRRETEAIGRKSRNPKTWREWRLGERESERQGGRREGRRKEGRGRGRGREVWRVCGLRERARDCTAGEIESASAEFRLLQMRRAWAGGRLPSRELHGDDRFGL